MNGTKLLDREVTTADIRKYLEDKYSDQDKYLALPEVRPYAGYGAGRTERYLDFWVLCCYPSERHARTTYEIKVSRGDFRKEIKDPMKRRMGLALSNYFYFITPPLLVKPEEVPEDCGLIEVYWTERQKRWNDPASTYEALAGSVVVQAPQRDPNVLSWGLLASLGRRLNKRAKQAEDLVLATRQLEY